MCLLYVLMWLLLYFCVLLFVDVLCACCFFEFLCIMCVFFLKFDILVDSSLCFFVYIVLRVMLVLVELFVRSSMHS